MEGLLGGTTSLAMTLVAFVGVLSIVVFIHEMGHFLVGRWCGVGVEVFSIGFGKELVGWTDRHGTRWRIAAVPLGGYVRFVGDVNAASSPDPEVLSHLTAAERERSFHHKSVGKRAAIVAAGPIANFLLAIAIFGGLTYVKGRQVLVPRVEVVQPGSAAQKAGFLPGDLVVSIDGREIASFLDMQRIVSASADDTLSIVVDRGGVRETLTAVPDLRETSTPFGKQRIGLLGIQAARGPDDLKTLYYGPLESVGVGVTETWHVVERTFQYLGKLVVGRESVDQLSGPIRIAQISGQVANMSGAIGLIGLVAVLSVSIGLINLFPIPMLDGGHLVFYAVEALRGRPLSERAQEIGFRIGLAIVAAMMLFATWNDLVHLTSAWVSGGT